MATRLLFRKSRTAKHKRIVSCIKQTVKNFGGAAYVLHQIGRLRGDAGLPDMIIFYLGRAAFVEVKTPGTRLTEAQREFGMLAREHGIDYVVGGVEEVAKWMGIL